ncbi:C39 family peptidase [Candidatus Obscuribacterales bacterium]|nr:C39 family peptidase [Candidatus Obscuribacterales bacterium]
MNPRYSQPKLVLRTLMALSISIYCSCSGSLAVEQTEKNHVAGLPANIIKIPMTRQATNYTCGVAALQSVLMFYGDEFLESELAKLLKANPKEGTAYLEMKRFSESRGYNVQVYKDMKVSDLKKLLDAGKPVICLIQAWPERKVNYKNDWDDGHYVVAIGYDDGNVYFMDPSTLGNYTYIPTDEFLVRWHDTDSKVKLHHFGMVVQKKAKRAYHADGVKKLE